MAVISSWPRYIIMRSAQRLYKSSTQRLLQRNQSLVFSSTNAPNSVSDKDEVTTPETTPIHNQMYRLRRTKTITKSTQPFSVDSENSSPLSNQTSEKRVTHSFSSHLSSATARHRKTRRHELKKIGFNIDDGNPELEHDKAQLDLAFFEAKKSSRGSVVAHMSATAKHRRSRPKVSSSSNIPNPSSVAILDVKELEDEFELHLEMEKTKSFGKQMSSSTNDKTTKAEKEGHSDDIISRLLIFLGIQDKK